MKTLLLHVCCGPCSLMPIIRLREEGFAVTAYFFNPNIHPQDEYQRRREAMRQVSELMGVPVVWEPETGEDAVGPGGLGEGAGCAHGRGRPLPRLLSYPHEGRGSAGPCPGASTLFAPACFIHATSIMRRLRQRRKRRRAMRGRAFCTGIFVRIGRTVSTFPKKWDCTGKNGAVAF